MKMIVCCCFVTCVFAQELNYTLPPITYMSPESTMFRARKRARRLMELKGIPGGDATLVCTNWSCPTTIVVNAVGYNVVTNFVDDMLEFDIQTTNQPSETIASGNIKMNANAEESWLAAFADQSLTSVDLQTYARRVIFMPIDPTTNMMFLANERCHPQAWQRLTYKNIFVRYSVDCSATNSVATNALAFAAAIINAGLPENERIPLPPAP